MHIVTRPRHRARRPRPIDLPELLAALCVLAGLALLLVGLVPGGAQ